eukprot:2117042-Rhodomonas_salina.1
MARVAPKTATMVFDVPMAKSGLRYTATIAKLCPDGILVELQNLYPRFTVTIVPFIIGSRSLLIKEDRDWTKHWLSLGLPTNALRPTIIDAMVRNQEALTDILA